MRAPLLAVLLAAGLLAGCTNVPGLGPALGDRTGPGERGFEYLRPSPYTSIIVELDYVNGAEPDAAALRLLESRFEAATGKPVDIVRAAGVPGQGASHKYTLQEIAELERAHRERYTGGSQAALYVLYLDGGFERDNSETSSLGAAYRGSSVVMFKGNLKAASKQSSLDLTKPPLKEVEEAVMVHELGHVLGLVNHGTPMVRPHEDRDHPGHSSNDASVMYWAVESSAIGAILGQHPPDDFDSDDKADLQAARNAR